jgi:hypothetical protein
LIKLNENNNLNNNINNNKNNQNQKYKLNNNINNIINNNLNIINNNDSNINLSIINNINNKNYNLINNTKENNKLIKKKRGRPFKIESNSFLKKVKIISNLNLTKKKKYTKDIFQKILFIYKNHQK